MYTFQIWEQDMDDVCEKMSGNICWKSGKCMQLLFLSITCGKTEDNSGLSIVLENVEGLNIIFLWWIPFHVIIARPVKRHIFVSAANKNNVFFNSFLLFRIL